MSLPRRHARCRGQATAEMVIGLIGLAVLFLGSLQVALLGDANIRNLIAARGQAEQRALTGDALSRNGRYIAGWSDVDPDGLRFTADDVPTSTAGGSLQRFQDELLAPVPIGAMGNYGLDPTFDTNLQASSLGVAANLHQGGSSADVPVENALRKFIVNGQRFIRLADDAYMPGLTIGSTP